jgi:FkbM family methyltransferase
MKQALNNKSININKNLIKNLFKKTILLFNKEIFCIISNLYFTIINSKVRFKYQKNGFYCAIEDDLVINFKNKEQALSVYKNGLNQRFEQLEKAYFLDKIKFSEGDVVVDCGANVGDIYFYFSKYLNLKIKYFGIEPSPDEFSALEKNVGSANALNIGLWNADSQLEFYVSSDGADSSLIRPQFFTEIINVKTHRLDSLLDFNIKILKLEAEGAEPEVTEGVKNIIHKIEYIAADLGFERGVDQESTLIPVMKILNEYNFELIHMSHDRICALFKNKNLG